MLKTKILGSIAVIAAAVIAQNYAFPSPMPPTGDTTGVKQIVSFIWDDNAYSGKKGTNYEGPSTKTGQFNTQNWVGAHREEGGWITTGPNELNIQEGDFGMGWAAYRLAGRNLIPYPNWDPNSDMLKSRARPYYGPNLPGGESDTVIYNETIYACTGWIIDAETNNTPPDQTPPSGEVVWTLVKPVGERVFKTNKDGTPVTMTFNVITGLIVSAFPIDYQSRESKFGYYVPNEEFYPVGEPYTSRHSKISVTWGREYAVFNDQAADAAKDVTKQFMRGYLQEIFQETIGLGHEIGNHTIDHMETNSPLPYSTSQPYGGNAVDGKAYMDGFSLWGGDGFDKEGVDVIKMPDGEELKTDEAKQFGQRQGNVWQLMGWQGYAGKILSIGAWEGLIKLGEKELTDAYGLSAAKGDVVSFRAPRLEVNSNMFWALKNLGYLYDCGNEEGYEYNMDGTNFLWPYTMDNGSPNVAWQRMVGENKSNFDSLPQGLWQYPVSVLIVPEDGGHRERVWKSYAEISAAEGNDLTQEDKEHWMRNGKITGFDFNLFILYGADSLASVATMRHSLDQRMRGGKAPMQIGCHTDYFTPIYDYATLSQEANKAYGIALKSNTWKVRIGVWEDIRDYGIDKGALFISGKEAIDYVKSLVKEAKVGDTEISITDIGQWESFNHNGKSQIDKESPDYATITTNLKGLPEDDAWEQAGFAVYGEEGEFEFDHISLSYSTSAPLTIRLITKEKIDENYPYEVTLGNLNGWNAENANRDYWAHSGQIPLSAFQRNQYVGDVDKNLIGLNVPSTEFTKKITGIEVAVQVPNGQNQTALVSIKDFKLFSGEQTEGLDVGIVKGQRAAMQKIAVLGMNGNSLRLNLVQKGLYNVDIVSVNGRLVKSFKDINLNAGVNTLPLNKLSSGMYMIRISNKQVKTTLKSLVL